MKKISHLLFALIISFTLLTPSIYPVMALNGDADDAADTVAVGYGALAAYAVYAPGLYVTPLGWAVLATVVLVAWADGDILGFGSDKPKNPQEAIQKCLKREPKQGELANIQEAGQQLNKNDQELADIICNSPESMNLAEGQDTKFGEDQEPDNTFVWKPVSDSDGNLLVLLPHDFSNTVISAAIKNGSQTVEQGKSSLVIEKGNFSGNSHNGLRAHFRFSKPGAAYGTNIELWIATTNKGFCRWKIANGAQRYESDKQECARSEVELSGGLGTTQANMDLNSTPVSCKVSKQTASTNETVTFEPQGANLNSYAYAWSGTGINQTGSTLKVIYDRAGSYIVNMIIKDTLGKSTTIPCPTLTITTPKKLSAECKVSDTTPAIDDEIDIWVEVTGGKSPYSIKWSGDDSKFDDFDDEASENKVTVERKRDYKLKVTVEDDDGKTIKDSCTTIKATDDGEDDDVIVRVVDTNTNVATTNTTTSTNTSSSYPYSRDLTVGASGADVAALQQYLVARGYLVMPAGVAYGYFGEVTRTAVARWQTAMGISPAAGYFGARSRAVISGGTVAMPAAAAVVPNPSVAAECIILNQNIYSGEESQNIARVQRFLVRLGYLVMPISADYGYYGPSTSKAISVFMSSRGISHQGAVMDATVRNEIKAASCQ